MSDRIDLSMSQFCDAWRMMCAPSPTYATESTAGADYIFSGLPLFFFNAALISARGLSEAALKEHGKRACAWAADKGVPWILVVTHEALEPGVDAVATMGECGMVPVMPLTGMLAERLTSAMQVPDGLQLTEPQTDDGCAALLDVNSLGYATDLGAGKSLLGNRAFWADHFPVLGLVDGTPATSSVVMMLGGYRYVALVATDPAHQRRGFADAAMRRALESSAAVHGERPTVLHATDAGRPVYERMGYTTISTHTLFMEARFTEGH
jgi:GNAT superfamily N-acetyltransferase